MTTDAETRALAVLTDMADESTIDGARTAVRDEIARWVFDPEVDGVIGLLTYPSPGVPATALVIVYERDRDFETSAAFEQFADHY